MEGISDALRLENQLCFPLYACSKELVRTYKPFLDALDLTYTQYIAMIVLWEKEEVSSRELGERLYLDSGTLTPMLRRLEQKGFLTRSRSSRDARDLIIRITPEGRALKDQAASIPEQMSCCVRLTPEERSQLAALLRRLMGVMQEG